MEHAALNSCEYRLIKCEDWDAFVTNVRRAPTIPLGDNSYQTASNAIFRGHSDANWVLSSTLERNLKLERIEVELNNGRFNNMRQVNGISWYDEQCKTLLEGFKNYSRGMIPDSVNFLDLDYWTYGRHFGLLSPYLDWTASPYIAAFFAFEEFLSKYHYCRESYPSKFSGGVVNIWALRYFNDVFVPGEFDGFS